MAFLRVSANVIGAHAWYRRQEERAPRVGRDAARRASSPAWARVWCWWRRSASNPSYPTSSWRHGEQKETRGAHGARRLRCAAHRLVCARRNGEQSTKSPRGGLAQRRRTARRPLRFRLRTRSPSLSDGRKTFEGMIVVPRGQILPLHVKMIPKYSARARLDAGRDWRWIPGRRHLRRPGVEQAARSAASRSRQRRAGETRIAVPPKAVGSPSVPTRALPSRASWAAWPLCYSINKDPLPESSVKPGKLLEFDDPLKARPVARLERRVRPTFDVAAREQIPTLSFTPSASSYGWRLVPGRQVLMLCAAVTVRLGVL